MESMNRWGTGEGNKKRNEKASNRGEEREERRMGRIDQLSLLKTEGVQGSQRLMAKSRIARAAVANENPLFLHDHRHRKTSSRF
jgi:hypothetical protein